MSRSTRDPVLAAALAATAMTGCHSTMTSAHDPSPAGSEAVPPNMVPPPGHGPFGVVETSGSSGLPIRVTVNRLAKLASDAVCWRTQHNHGLSWSRDLLQRLGNDRGDGQDLDRVEVGDIGGHRQGVGDDHLVDGGVLDPVEGVAREDGMGGGDPDRGGTQ